MLKFVKNKKNIKIISKKGKGKEQNFIYTIRGSSTGTSSSTNQ